MSTLEELSQLEPDWDGYGALEVTPFALEEAARVLTAVPSREDLSVEAYPLVDGSIDLNWLAGKDNEHTMIIHIPCTAEEPLEYVIAAHESKYSAWGNADSYPNRDMPRYVFALWVTAICGMVPLPEGVFN